MPQCKVRAAKRAPTLRKMSSSTLSAEGDDVQNNASQQVMIERSNSMTSRAKDKVPFTTEEIQDVINSLHNITPANSKIDWEALARLLQDIAHVSHKDWHITGSNSDKMADVLLPEGSGLTANEAHQMFERILHEGNWDGALEHAKNSINKSEKSWAVLVTGVNGIRKTTSMYQPWFANVLQEALIPPSSEEEANIALNTLPNGNNSFFRQLDHMICTLCNEEFSTLYALTSAQLENDNHPPKELVKQYSNLKASIFSRYRTLSELLGVLLLKEAQNNNINAMCETSGRDIAMFHYIDHFFFNEKYNKLAIHFTINDLSYAKQSVDDRMIKEMKMGKAALESEDLLEVIYANAGGPYGSEVLDGVQADSDRVWNDVIMKAGDGGKKGVGEDWYKASLRVNAYDDKPWTIQAVKKDGSLGTVYTFGEPRSV